MTSSSQKKVKFEWGCQTRSTVAFQLLKGFGRCVDATGKRFNFFLAITTVKIYEKNYSLIWNLGASSVHSEVWDGQYCMVPSEVPDAILRYHPGRHMSLLMLLERKEREPPLRQLERKKLETSYGWNNMPQWQEVGYLVMAICGRFDIAFSGGTSESFGYKFRLSTAYIRKSVRTKRRRTIKLSMICLEIVWTDFGNGWVKHLPIPVCWAEVGVVHSRSRIVTRIALRTIIP
ncbi:hypothetical protein Tco_0785159 [Tanacetum coccineum]